MNCCGTIMNNGNITSAGGGITAMWRNAIVPRFRAVGAAAVRETNMMTHSLVHAVAQPIDGLVRGGTFIIQETKQAMGMGVVMVHIVVGVLAGYALYEVVRVAAPSLSATLSDAMTRPFKRSRRMVLDSSDFY